MSCGIYGISYSTCQSHGSCVYRRPQRWCFLSRSVSMRKVPFLGPDNLRERPERHKLLPSAFHDAGRGPRRAGRGCPFVCGPAFRSKSHGCLSWRIRTAVQRNSGRHRAGPECHSRFAQQLFAVWQHDRFQNSRACDHYGDPDRSPISDGDTSARTARWR